MWEEIYENVSNANVKLIKDVQISKRLMGGMNRECGRCNHRRKVI